MAVLLLHRNSDCIFTRAALRKPPQLWQCRALPAAHSRVLSGAAELRGRDGPSSLAAQRRVGMPKAGLCLQTGFKEDGEKRDTV